MLRLPRCQRPRCKVPLASNEDAFGGREGGLRFGGGSASW